MVSVLNLLQALTLLCVLSSPGLSDTTVQQGKCVLVVEDEVREKIDVVHNGQTYEDVDVVISNTYRGYRCKQAYNSPVCTSTHLKAQSFAATPSMATYNEAKTHAICIPDDTEEIEETTTVSVGGSQVEVTVQWSNITSCTCHRFAASS